MKKHILLIFVILTSLETVSADEMYSGEEIRIEKTENIKPVTDYLPIDPEKAWEFTASIKGESGRLEMYLYQYDKLKRRIGPTVVNAVPGTETMLSAPAEKGLLSFTVEDASKWDVPQKGKIIVFYAQSDLNDIPNFNIEYYIEKVTQQEKGFLVQMSKELSKSYPVDTMVRLHHDGAHLSLKVNLPEPKEYSRLIEPAPQFGALADHWWRGTFFVQLALSTTSDEPVVLEKWSLREVSPAELEQLREVQHAAILAEKQKIIPFGYSKILVSGNGTEEFSNCFFYYKGVRYYYSGIYQESLDLLSTRIEQFEVDFKSTTPGTIDMSLNQKVDGKIISSSLSGQSVIPDGQYRRFIFIPRKSANWNPQSKLVGWTLNFKNYNEIDKVIGFRNPEFKHEKNLIAGAEKLLPNITEEISGLRPLGKYLLEWRGKKSPGVTLDFYDHLLKPIPGNRILLKPEQEKIEFTTPEALVQTKITVNGKGGWPCITALSERTRYTPNLFWRGLWIWSRKTEGPEHANVWFSKDFDLTEAPEYAGIAFMADDKSFVYVNNVYVGGAWGYRNATQVDITKLLKSGRNRIAIRVYNLDQAAGLCADVYLKTSKHDIWYPTDFSWLCKETGNDETLPEKFHIPSVELGPPATTVPWNAYVRFSYVGPKGIFTLIKAENGVFMANVKNPVVETVRIMNFNRCSTIGKTNKFSLPVTLTQNIDGTVTVKYPKLLPMAETCKVYLDDDFWVVAENRPLSVLAAKAPTAPGLEKAEFVEVGNRTKIKFNGDLHDPTFLWSSERARQGPAIAAGFNSFSVTAQFDEFWLSEGQYDFTKLDGEIETLLTVAPNAIFMLDIRFFMPEWWIERNPDDASAYFEKTRRQTYDDVQALGSKNWLVAAEAPLTALLNHVKKKFYADRIWGANIGDSRGNEWFWGGAAAGKDFFGKPAQPGYSASDLSAFRAMLRRKYGSDAALAKAWRIPGLLIDSAEMPDHKLRRTGHVGSLFSPEVNMQIMDWCLFRNQSLAEAIIYFAKRIKAHTDRKWLVGAYYGYLTELSESPNRSQLITGHNGFLDCVKSSNLDFFRAPSRYTYRKTGMPNGVMQTFSTFSLHNKVVFIENDERTAYGPSEGSANDVYTGRGTTALESVGHINREFGMMSTLGIAHYWMDHPTGSLYEPALLSVIADQLKVYKSLPPVNGFTPAEVSVVGDVGSIYYSIDGPDGIFPSAISGVFKRLNYLSVPFRSMVIADLLEKDLAPYCKFYIMLPTLVLGKEEREQLLQRFDREKATVVWLYSAGSSYPDRGPKGEYCGDFLGLKCTMDASKIEETLVTKSGKYASLFNGAPHFYPEKGYDTVLGSNESGRPVVVVKKSDGAKHIFSALPDLPKEIIGDLMTQAGVSRYTDSMSDPLWIGNDLVFLHAAAGGAKKIRIPQNLRMRAIIGPLSGVFESEQSWNAVAGLSYGFLVEKK